MLGRRKGVIIEIIAGITSLFVSFNLKFWIMVFGKC